MVRVSNHYLIAHGDRERDRLDCGSGFDMAKISLEYTPDVNCEEILLIKK
jgi:hypothetical protein